MISHMTMFWTVEVERVSEWQMWNSLPKYHKMMEKMISDKLFNLIERKRTKNYTSGINFIIFDSLAETGYTFSFAPSAGSASFCE